MSHEAPIYGYDWFQKAENLLKEYRVGFDLTVMRDNVYHWSDGVLTFVSNHQAQLLGAILSVFVLAGVVALAHKAWTLQNALQNALDKWDESDKWRKRYQAWYNGRGDVIDNLYDEIIEKNDFLTKKARELSSLKAEMDEQISMLELEQLKVETLTEELSEMTASRDWHEQDRDEWRDSAHDAMSDRDYYQEEADNWESKHDDLENDLSEAQERISELESFVETYKEYQETTLKLAA